MVSDHGLDDLGDALEDQIPFLVAVELVVELEIVHIEDGQGQGGAP